MRRHHSLGAENAGLKSIVTRNLMELIQI